MTEFICPKGHIPKPIDIIRMNGYCPECGLKISPPRGESSSTHRMEESRAAVKEYIRRKKAR